jgi:hypothetical protein
MQSAVAKYRDILLYGRVLVIDPSSGSAGSMPGYAVYDRGILSMSGVLIVNHKNPIEARLRQIMELLQEMDEKLHPQLCLLEKIRGGRAHPYLVWSCGIVVASMTCPHVEVCISTWKSFLDKDEYVKGDERDAIGIGQAMINMALGLSPPKKVRAKKVKKPKKVQAILKLSKTRTRLK